MPRRFVSTRKSVLSLVAIIAASFGGPALADGDAIDRLLAVVPGTPILDVRYRYEMVDQAGFTRDAHAHTVRTRFGYETIEWNHFKLLVEAEAIAHLGADHFNDTVNGRVVFPVVPDPDAIELNRLQLAFTGVPDTVVVAGRQRVILDNARFVGNVGFRQNEQTFDGVLLVNKSIPDVELAYAYFLQVNRIFGDDSPVGDFNSDIHVLRAGYSGLPFGNLQAYAYLAEIDDVKALSSQTYGARFTGSQAVGPEGLKVLYTGEYAHQMDYGNNPLNFDHYYLLAEGGLAFKGLTAKGGIEILDGNGTTALQTPFATLHAFQGWTDRFVLATPAGGIEDVYISLVYAVPLPESLGIAPSTLSNVKLLGVYHDFQAEAGGLDYGTEYNAQISATLFDRFTLAVKYAAYEAQGFSIDTDKLWLTFGFKL